MNTERVRINLQHNAALACRDFYVDQLNLWCHPRSQSKWYVRHKYLLRDAVVSLRSLYRFDNLEAYH